MKHKTTDTRYMATLAMLCGLLIVMGMTGIGFIPLPVIKATTMHIPVILGAILLGPKAGAILGARCGEEALPEFYMEGLEVAETLLELADDLIQGCPMVRGNKLFDGDWDRKYLHGEP